VGKNHSGNECGFRVLAKSPQRPVIPSDKAQGSAGVLAVSRVKETLKVFLTLSASVLNSGLF